MVKRNWVTAIACIALFSSMLNAVLVREVMTSVQQLRTTTSLEIPQASSRQATDPIQDRKIALQRGILQRYRTDPVIVEHVVNVAHKYEHPDFPRATDILALVGIESGWNPFAKSNLEDDPAIGLTQIRPIVWKKMISSPAELYVIDNQIKYAAMILRQNYIKLKTKDAAVIAYNVGIGAYLESAFTPDFLNRFRSEVIKLSKL